LSTAPFGLEAAVGSTLAVMLDILYIVYFTAKAWREEEGPSLEQQRAQYIMIQCIAPTIRYTSFAGEVVPASSILLVY
jgi:hypothetical protein